MLNIRENGIIEVEGLIVGKVEERAVEGDGNPVPELRITLDLGWCKAAGLHVTLLDDREIENHRGGKAFDR